MKKSGICEEFKKIRFNNFTLDNKHKSVVRAKEEAIKYFKEFMDIKDKRKNSIAFTSVVWGSESTGIGAGKTHLSIAIANNIIDRYKIGVLYLPYRDVFTSLKQNMIDEAYYQREVSKYKNASVLLIDDLYKGKITQSDYNILFEIINYRYLKNLPVIISTELSPEMLIDHDEAIASRILDMTDFKNTRHNYTVEIGVSKEEFMSGISINHRLT